MAEGGAEPPFFRLTCAVDRPAGSRLPIADLTWYRRFLDRPAPGFLIEHELPALAAEAELDLLVFCRNALADGGVLRISLPDPRHPLPGYQSLIARRRHRLRTAEEWLGLLDALGFAPRLVEGHLADGRFVAEPLEPARFGPVARSSRSDPRAADPALRMSSLILDARREAGRPPRLALPQHIFAVGDSHVRFLAGRDETSARQARDKANWYEHCSARITGVHLGPGLAHNANRPGARTACFEKLCRLTSGPTPQIPAGARILLSYGEIDCRYHVVRQAEAQGRPIEAIVDEICEAYAGLLDRLAAAGYRPGIWGAVAPSWLEESGDPEHPIHGSFAQRLAATRRFNLRMAEACRRRGMPFLCLVDELLDATGRTDRRWFADGIHLSQRARPLLYGRLPPLSDAPPP